MNAFFALSGLPILVGVFILSRFIVQFRKGLLRGNWPSVTGKIITSKIKEGTFGEFNSISYTAVVRYLYTVNLVEYESDVISASEAPFAIGKEWYAKSQVDKYKVDNQVSVFYNPENPKEAVLEKSGASTSGMLLLLVLGIILVVCGLAPWFLGIFH